MAPDPDDAPVPLLVEWAISLTEPWALLCAIDAKKRETRCWPTKFRGWIAIHAAKAFPNECREICLTEPFRSALRGAGIKTLGDVPRGKVLAVARLTECIPTAKWTPAQDSDEFAFGNYEAIDSDNGKPRYSFALEGTRRLREPFDCRGALGIWRLPRSIMAADLV